MKKIYTLLAAFVPVLASAQFSLTVRETSVFGPNSGDFSAVTSMTNNATDPNDTMYMWKIIAYTYPQDWTLSFCDPFYCNADAGLNDSYTFKLGIGKSGILKGDIFFNGYSGTGTLRVLVQSVKNPSITDTFTVHANAWVTSVRKTSKSQSVLSVFPNPAKDILSVQVPVKHTVTIEIYNVLGSKVKTYEHDGSETAKIDVSELQKGIYFIRINDNGVLYTKQFQKLN